MRAVLPVLFALAAAGAAAQQALPATAPATATAPAAARPGAPAAALPVTTGLASWYGWQFHGRPTASGEPYDMDGFTAAHRTLPFGTQVRVSLIDGSASVDVRINDRGPFVEDRIIDLSLGAARQLGIMHTGVAEVRLRVVGQPQQQRYVLQIGSFGVSDNARSLLRRLQARSVPAALETAGAFTRVVTEPATEAELPAIEERLRSFGINAWVRRLCSEPHGDGAAPGRTPCPAGV